MIKKQKTSSVVFKVFAYVFCILLAIISLLPFVIMIINSTRSTTQIQQHAISLVPSTHLLENFKVLTGKTFDPIKGFINSMIISCGATICTVYFSTMTAYALVAYDWRLRKPFFTMIMCVLMIPAQVTTIGFYQFMYSIGMTNNFLALILPAIAVQAIFAFIANWNNLYTPQMILLSVDVKKKTLPMMISSLMASDKIDYGVVYITIALSILPIIIAYIFLSKFIIAGVALGGVKE